MSKSNQNIPPNFQSEEEAFEYLIQQSQNKVLKDQWKMELDQLPDAPLENKSILKSIYLKRAIAMAASFIILLGSFYWFVNKESSLQQMAEAMIEETNFVLITDSHTRGLNSEDSDNQAIELQKKINDALERKDYKTSIALYGTKEKNSQLSITDKFYYSLSIARAKTADHNKAIQMLDDVISKDEKLSQESMWLQALLYLKINDPNNSKKILNKLINNSNYQITNTRALLNKMPN